MQASRKTIHGKTALSLDFPETVIDELSYLCLFKSRAEWSDGLSAAERNSGYLVAVLMGTWNKICGGSEMSEGTSLFFHKRSDRVLKNRRSYYLCQVPMLVPQRCSERSRQIRQSDILSYP
jgi:hypothetical protein